MNTQQLLQSILSKTQWRCAVKGQRMLMGLLIVGLVLILAVGLTQAQELNPEDETTPEEEAGVSSIVPIQGRLTDASGNTLNGSHSVTARIYDVGSGGTALCDDTDAVTVENGLFNMDMHFCSPTDISGDQLYLGIQVGSDPEMTPRKAIYPVPYAWTVKPGAIIKGANSYVFVPGNMFFKNNSNDSTRWDMSGGAARIYRGVTAGSKDIRIPITLPSVLYGQPVRVTSISIYYMCSNGAQAYITETQLYKNTDADSWQTLVIDGTSRQSNLATSYSISTDGNYNTLSSSQGILSLRLKLAFNNDTDYVQIAGVRLTLNHNY